MLADIEKGKRYSKIIGEFGEHLLCNWLSRSGLEVARVDHTGIDIVAYLPPKGPRIGISVKSRTRRPVGEGWSVGVFGRGDRDRLADACTAFNCVPWIGIYIETTGYADLYLVSLENYDRLEIGDTWRMGRLHRERYDREAVVKHIRIEFSPKNWQWP